MMNLDTVANLDRLQAQLEASIAKLQVALKHWQISEAEYEGLKEELHALPEAYDETRLAEVAADYGGDLVTKKEVQELFRLQSGSSRPASQIIGLLDRRIDYVQKNVETLNKQLRAAEEKLDRVHAVSETETRNEEGLPVTDIYEELDEDGNVISSRVSQPKDAEAQILKALGKAGVKKQDLSKMNDSRPRDASQSSPATAVTEATSTTAVPTAPVHNAVPKPVSPTISAKSIVPAAVTTTDATSSAPVAPKAITKQPSAALQDLAKHSMPEGGRVIETNSDDEAIGSIGPKAPIKESAADAAMRARMLEYSMREVGNIVAQLDLEEGDVSDGDDDLLVGDEEDWDDEEQDDDDEEMRDEYDDRFDASSVEDEEDVHGLSRTGGLSEAYRRDMLALEKRLGARMFENVGPNPDLSKMERLEETELAAGAGPAADAPAVKTANQPKEKPKAGKGVRFAEELDVAPAPIRAANNTASQSKSATSKQPAAGPMKDTIIERRPIAPSDPSIESPKKLSRFKAARQAQAPQPQSEVTPHRSATQPLSDTIIERPIPSNVTAPSEDLEYDPQIQRQQLEAEFHRQRNRQVQRQGGFTKVGRGRSDDGDEDGWEDGEEEVDENGKKMSLFRRARVSGWQAGRGQG